MRPEQLLQSAVTLYEAPTRTTALPDRFDTLKGAMDVITDVLIHEARESLQNPLTARPEAPYLHPVDVDTSEPGIVSSNTSMEILRMQEDQVPRIGYRLQESEMVVEETSPDDEIVVKNKTRRASEREADRRMTSAIRKGERSAETDERRRERKRERDSESPNTRERRLQEQREKKRLREERGASEVVEGDRPATTSKPRRTRDPFPDTSMNVVLTRPRVAGRSRGSERFYEHPLPHHRHLAALRRVSPHSVLRDALLRADSSDALEIVQGPPGTGKTMRLVECLSRLTGRVFLCAPTNVGAANLYMRCVQTGYGDECALLLAPDRVPPGTAVQSNDPSRRIVCATISSRSGPILDTHSFESVLVDEAAQCMEAWVWTLLRPDVSFLALAGDVQQLPAMVSESGRALRHDRSLMERLLSQGYDNTTSLTVQNRMCPEIMELTNGRFYEGRLTCGPHAPARGVVEFVDVSGREREDGTSYYNMEEVDAICNVCNERNGENTSLVVLCPYVAQGRRVMSRRLGVAVHTIDSFQGREADVVILSMVRDGSSGLGFWSDHRRLVVALTRARSHLVVVVSNRSTAWSNVF